MDETFHRTDCENKPKANPFNISFVTNRTFGTIFSGNTSNYKLYTMKRILTLLIALGVFGAVSAQTSKEDARRIILGQGKDKGGNTSERSRDVILGDGDNDNNRRTYPNSYPSSGNSSVDQINREYDAKINSIRNNPNLSRAEKERIIRQLENDRKRKINQVRNDRDDDRRDDDRKYKDKKDKKHKSNNGKHKGWTKGKGNPHRDRDDD